MASETLNVNIRLPSATSSSSLSSPVVMEIYRIFKTIQAAGGTPVEKERQRIIEFTISAKAFPSCGEPSAEGFIQAPDLDAMGQNFVSKYGAVLS